MLPLDVTLATHPSMSDLFIILVCFSQRVRDQGCGDSFALDWACLHGDLSKVKCSNIDCLLHLNTSLRWQSKVAMPKFRKSK